MATSDIKIDEGTEVQLATYSITGEDTGTKELARAVLNTSAGVEISPATSGKQDSIKGVLDSVLTELEKKADVTETQPVSISGGATSAKQDTGNTSLASIDGKLTDVATQTTLALIKAKTDNLDTALSGIKTGTDKIVTGGSTLAEQQTQTAEIGAINETVPSTDTATSGLNGRLQRIAQRITSLIDSILKTKRTYSSSEVTRVNVSYSSAQTNTVLVNAPGSGKKLVIVDLYYTRESVAGNMKLVEDPAGTPVARWGSHYFAITGGISAPNCYIPLDENKALGITTVGGGNETLSALVITENV